VNLNQGEHFGDAFRTKSPLAKVPALELDDGRVLTETRAICTYLEGLTPEPNLMGVGFEERAFIEMADRRVEWSLLLGIANGVRHTHPGLAALESPQFADFGQSQTQKARPTTSRRQTLPTTAKRCYSFKDSAQGSKRSKENKAINTPKAGAAAYKNSIGNPMAADVAPRVSIT
jgi:glutathione S-transferase